MPTIPTRRALDILLTALTLTILSCVSFAVIYKDPNTFSPAAARLTFLLSTLLSWPFLLTSVLLSAIGYHKAPDRFANAQPGLRTFIFAVSSAIAGVVALLVAQAAWIYVVARARVVWLLSLVVLALAMMIIILASAVAVLAKAITIANQQEQPKTVAHPDTPYPHNVASLPFDDELVF